RPSGWGTPPHRRRKEADNQVQPDPRDGSGNPCPFSGHDPHLRCVTEESGGEVKEAKPHFFNLSSKVLSHQAVSRFVNGGHTPKQEPELNEVRARLLGEVVEREDVSPYLSKTIGPHPSHEDEHANARPDKPGSKKKPHLGIQPRDVFVGVVPGLYRD